MCRRLAVAARGGWGLATGASSFSLKSLVLSHFVPFPITAPEISINGNGSLIEPLPGWDYADG
jgi:hypothetical protein